MTAGTPIAFHLMLRLADDRVIAPDVPARRALSRVVLRHGRPRGLLAFGAADTHIHLLALGNRRDVGTLAHAIELGLRHALQLPVPWEAARVRPVVDQRHLGNAFHYVLRQAAHHALVSSHPFEGTSLPDLLGMRVIGAWLRPLVRERLPRVTRTELLDHLGCARLEPAFDLDRLADAAAAAVGVESLSGRARVVVAARSAAVHAGTGVVRPGALAASLSIPERHLRYLRALPADPALVRAIGLQIGFWRGGPEPRRASESRDRHPGAWPPPGIAPDA